MSSRDIIKEHINHILTEDSLYTQTITEIFNEKVTDENIQDFVTLIKLLKIHEESYKQTRRVLQLKQQSYLIKKMETPSQCW